MPAAEQALAHLVRQDKLSPNLPGHRREER